MTQEFSSKNTSINSNRIPKIFTIVTDISPWKEGSVNLDLGGGKFDNVQDYFYSNSINVNNLIYDPFNRSEEHNEHVFNFLACHKADTATISNVLNVIKEDKNKEKLIKLAHDNLIPNGLLFVSIYQGNRSNVGNQTGKDQWQENKKINEYLEIIKRHFSNVKVKKGIIVCEK